MSRERCKDPRCKLAHVNHVVGFIGCDTARDGRCADCKLKDRVSCVHTDVTVFEAKGRRVTTRAKEERGGGRRNASRAKKTFGQTLGEAADRVMQAARSQQWKCDGTCPGDEHGDCYGKDWHDKQSQQPRNSHSPNKSLLERIMAYPLPVDPKAFTAYKLTEVTPEMDLNWSRVQATTKALHDLKEAVTKLLYLGPRARGSCKGSDLWANYTKQERRVQRLVKL